MQRVIKKKGLSPVIATTLLILIGLVIAAIIFLWARSFIAEKIQKDVTGQGGEAIEQLCDDVQFDSQVKLNGPNLDVEISNKGNIPIWGVEVRKKGFFVKTVAEVKNPTMIKSGEDYSSSVANSNNLIQGSKIVIVPVLLGETADTKVAKGYTCGDEFGIVDVVA